MLKKERNSLQILTETNSLILMLIVLLNFPHTKKQNKWNNEIKVQKGGNRKEYIQNKKYL